MVYIAPTCRTHEDILPLHPRMTRSDASQYRGNTPKHLFNTNISYYIEKVDWVWGENKLEDRESQGGGQKINIDSKPYTIYINILIGVEKVGMGRVQTRR